MDRRTSGKRLGAGVALAVLGISLVAACAAQAADIEWTGATDSDWNTAGNWSPARVPTIDDVVWVPAETTYCPALENTGVCGGLVLADGASVTVATSAGLSIIGQGDLDGDGISDWYESDPSVFGDLIDIDGDSIPNFGDTDSDGDGMTDEWEYKYQPEFDPYVEGVNGTDYGPDDDCDGDELTNLQESLLGTDPCAGGLAALNKYGTIFIVSIVALAGAFILRAKWRRLQTFGVLLIVGAIVFDSAYCFAGGRDISGSPSKGHRGLGSLRRIEVTSGLYGMYTRGDLGTLNTLQSASTVYMEEESSLLDLSSMSLMSLESSGLCGGEGTWEVDFSLGQDLSQETILADNNAYYVINIKGDSEMPWNARSAFVYPRHETPITLVACNGTVYIGGMRGTVKAAISGKGSLTVSSSFQGDANPYRFTTTVSLSSRTISRCLGEDLSIVPVDGSDSYFYYWSGNASGSANPLRLGQAGWMEWNMSLIGVFGGQNWDLTPSWGNTFPGTAKSRGSLGTVTLRVTNAGTVNTGTNSWHDGLYLSRDAVFDAGDLQLDEGLADEWDLSSRGSGSHNFTVTLPDVAPGKYYLLGVADCLGQLVEEFENNNVVASELVVDDAVLAQ